MAFIVNIVLLLGVALLSSAPWCEAGNLWHDFYKRSCPSAESTVEKVVKKYIQKDQTLAAPLLRMHFHDCFVRVCLTLSQFMCSSFIFAASCNVLSSILHASAGLRWIDSVEFHRK